MLNRRDFGAGLFFAAATTRALAQPAARSATFNVRDFGAAGDGKQLDTGAIQAAIDACTQARGGIVTIPAGDFLVGTIELKSNVTLHLAAAGRLVGSGTPEHYSAGRGIPPSNGNVVLLFANDAENIGVEGPGTIDGQGALFFNGRGDNTGPGGNRAAGYTQRPHLAIFYRCRNVALRNVFLKSSAYHCVRILECRYISMDGVRIHNRVNLNNDGFHFNSCEHVNVTNCDIACQDDACALFGSNRFVTVSNSKFSTRWSVFRFGGGKTSEVAVSNCLIYDTFGCPIKMRFGANSGIENATFSNLIFNNVTGPISIGVDSTRRNAPADAGPLPRGYARNIQFNGIQATVVAQGRQYADMGWPQNYRAGETRSCIVLNGANEDFLEGIHFNSIHATFAGGGTREEARREIPQMAGEYFEIGTPPAYGLYARGVRHLTLSDIRLETTAPDLRPAIVLDHMSDAAFQSVSAQGNPEAESVMRLVESRDIHMSSCRLLTPASTFVAVEGAHSENIAIEGGDVSKAAKPFTLSAGAPAAAVRMRRSD
jgi:hypothetical protein